MSVDGLDGLLLSRQGLGRRNILFLVRGGPGRLSVKSQELPSADAGRVTFTHAPEDETKTMTGKRDQQQSLLRCQESRS